MILFDTDICINILRGNNQIISRRNLFDQEIAISFMTVAELYYGAEKSQNPAKNIRLIEQFFLTLKILNSDYNIMRLFGKLKTELESQGSPLADVDLLIAATCLTHCNLLVTGNVKHYERIHSLKIENWIR